MFTRHERLFWKQQKVTVWLIAQHFDERRNITYNQGKFVFSAEACISFMSRVTSFAIHVEVKVTADLFNPRLHVYMPTGCVHFVNETGGNDVALYFQW